MILQKAVESLRNLRQTCPQMGQNGKNYEISIDKTEYLSYNLYRKHFRAAGLRTLAFFLS